MARKRLDAILVDRGLARSRADAHEAIAGGRVLVNGSVAEKPSRQVSPADAIVVAGGGPSFVSRGGKKLERALDAFSIDPTGRSAVDAGSSTGGFTDCLLQRGAGAVLAVDVGYGQLHERLCADPRVVSLERTNIRELDRDRARELLAPARAPDLVTADLSFMSLRPICARLLEMCGPEGEVVVLCKPQFEVGRLIASKGQGVVRSREDRRSALLGVAAALDEAAAAVSGVIASPILGPAGNAEFLVHARAGRAEPATVGAMIDAALDEAEAL